MDTTSPISSPIPAPISARLLALFIDYVFLSALIFFMGKALGHSDLVFVPTFLVAGFYFTFCNSELASGQSLGKRVLGLRTLGEGKKIYIDPGRSALRFLLSFGIIILLSEIPVLVYRHFALVAEPFFLELHMLLVMVFASVSLFFACLTKSKKSLHDIMCSTQVLRCPVAPDSESFLDSNSPDSAKSRFPIFLLASFIAIALWSFGILQPRVVSNVASKRYEIENKFNIRVISLGVASGPLEMIALVPTNKKEEKQKIAESIGKYMLENKLIPDETFKELLFLLHAENDTERPQVSVFDTMSQTVKNVEQKK